jgi:hypothetical protein
MRNSRNATRAGARFTILVESQMTRQRYRLLLEDSILMAGERRPADEAAVRAFLRDDECAMISVFRERQVAEFQKRDGLIIGTVRCQSCKLETPAVETA